MMRLNTSLWHATLSGFLEILLSNDGFKTMAGEFNPFRVFRNLIIKRWVKTLRCCNETHSGF